MKEKKLPSLGFHNVRITRDNEIMYAISTLGTENVVRARPRNIASCRGDAPGLYQCPIRPLWFHPLLT